MLHIHKPLPLVLPMLLAITGTAAVAQHQAATKSTIEPYSGTPAITVYASRFEEPLTDALPQTQIVTAADIQKSGARNVSEVLSRVAGLPMRLNLDGSTNAVIDLRGFGDAAPNNVVVLLDGVRLSEHEQTMARTSMIPIEAIDHIEITKTGNSVLFGDGANGGTINIVTRKLVGPLTVMSAGLASYSGYQSNIYRAQPLENSELSLYARQYASDHYRSNSRGNELSAGASWIARIDSQSNMGVRFLASRERNKLPGALPSVLLNTSPRNSQVPDYNWDADVDVQSLSFFGKRTLQNLEFAMDLGYRSKKTADAYSYDAYNVFSGYRYEDWRQSYGSSSNQSDTQSWSPRLKIKHFIVPNNTLQWGYDWLKTTKEGQAYLTFGCSNPASTMLCNNGGADAGGNTYQIVHQSKGLYVRDTLELSSNDRVVLGHRRESYAQSRRIDYGYGPSVFSTRGTAHASELQYVRAFKPQLTGYLRLSQNFRIANADDNANVAYAPPDYTQPSLLRVQTSRDMDIGLNHQSDMHISEASFFRSETKNEIGFDPSGCGYACNVNYDPTRREGFNFRYKLSLTRSLAFRTTLQYVDARFVEGPYTGKTVPGVTAFSGQLSMDYRLSQKEQLTLTTRWAQSRYMSGDFTNSQSKVPGYAVQDLSYIYREKNWSVVASLLNLFNKQYADTGIYKPSYSSPYHQTVYPNPGRSWSLTGRYAF